MDLGLDDLTVTIDGRDLVDRLSLSVSSGEIVGLVGPNGSGKSTALRCVYRALKPSAGIVRIGGDDIWRLPLRDSAQRVAALTQEGGADFDFTVEEVVALGRTPYKRGNDPLTDSERELCARAMNQMDVLDLAHRGIMDLSGGEKQRVLIARALVQEPSILILDEPTNHLDLRHQIQLLGHLRRCGLTVVIVLHDLNLAAATCNRIGVLSKGHLVASGAPREVLTRELIAEVFGVSVFIVSHPITGNPQILFTLTGDDMQPPVASNP
ncbi:ABC transporter ATP-binding protein [Rhodococcus artemisiae]|uniref:ABC transporter ATP-binding protein n=2 Tax=Rhodococcus artemisiae TaxID=714159 RepID=A0ABU7LAD8_9NOCA|nr:ABC transporter ATP-binding protein [Rhodococcus artemisiae]MEE2058518.1 ABC transporter ATP-binding protein [Rhodococcus artemisiae]